MQRATSGRYPRFVVWENVLGAFSSNKGLDFKTVLEQITDTEIPMPRSGKWAPAGVVRGRRCDIAWRVLDAQYWGVPQRRKRIFLVADFAKHGRCADKILFEPKSVQGDITQGAKETQSSAEGIEASAYQAGAMGVDAAASIANSTPVIADGTPPLKVKNSIAVYDMTHASDVVRLNKNNAVSTLQARMGTGGNQVPIINTYATTGYHGVRQSDKSATLKRLGGNHQPENYVSNGFIRRLTPLELDEYLQEVDVYGAKEGIKALFVLRKNHGTEKTLEWCFAIVERIQQAEILQQGLHEKSVSAKTTHGKKLDDDTLPCEEYIAEWLLRDMWQQSNDRCSPQRWESAEQFVRKLNESVQKLSHENTPSQKEMCDMWKAAEGTRLLRETFTAVQEIWESVYCKKEWARRSVRRLIPLETERLQGLPDNWTLINDKSCSDTARYKAIGNGMAQPCADFVMQNIKKWSE